MGWPLAAVNDLPERELSLWMVRGPLWPRRLEFYLMQLTAVLAQVNGNRKGMADFDLSIARTPPDAGDAADGLRLLTGGRVRRLGQGRKRPPVSNHEGIAT